jgi:hypothetical protein
MKRTVSSHIGMVLLACASLAPMLNTSRAASLTPIATGDAVVGATGDRANLALASGGGVPFSSSDLTDNYASDRVNDGVNDNTGNSWISLTTGTNEYVGVTLPGPSTISAMVFDGETGYGGRSAGTWSLQYTLAADPATTTSWTEIGEYVYSEPTCAQPMPRSLFAFPAINNVTGIRLVLKNSACINLAVQELEAYSPFTAPPAILTQPQSTNVMVGDMVTLSVSAENGESFQWSKDGTNISGAGASAYFLANVKLSDAGSYKVVVNGLGAVTSSVAVLTVTAAPAYASSKDAILADKPIHYYPLDETNGTVAADLGSKAGGGGTYTGGITLGQSVPTSQMGKAAAFFDGRDGSFVDLGVFHPGDAVTLEAWVNMATDASTAYKAVIARWDGSYEMDATGTDVGNLVIRNDSNAFGLVATAKPFQRNVWTHIASKFENGVLTIFMNGEQGTSQDLGGILQDQGLNTPDRVMIGATRAGILCWRGKIAQVAIYDKGLTAGQIRAHYQAAMPPQAPGLNTQNAVLVSWPSFPAGFILQGTPNLQTPVWSADTNTVRSEGGLFKVALPTGSENSFFRVTKP